MKVPKTDRTFLMQRRRRPDWEHDKYNITLYGHAEMTADDLCEMFEHFLRACGYNMANRHVELVEDETEGGKG